MTELSVREVATDDSAYKPQLVPVLRIATHTPVVDLAQRAYECIVGFLPPSADRDSHIAAMDSTAGLFDVPDPEPLYAAVSPGARARVQDAARILLRTLEEHLAHPLGTVSRLELSCLTEAQFGLQAGTVVLVRESEVVTEQYAFPYVRVDVTTGRIALALPPAPRPAPITIRADADVIQTEQQLVGAFMAVTPFLPPPFGPVVTGVLSFANLMLGLAREGGGGGPSPLDLAVQSIENFVKDTNLGNLAGAISGPANEFANMAANQKENLETLTSIDGGISYMGDLLKNTWTPAVVTANSQLYEVLKTCNTTNFDKTLSLLVSGITTELLMYHAQVAIGAVDASIQYRHKKLDKYRKATSTWTAVAGTAATDIGTSHAGNWTDQEITDAMGKSTSYLPRIEAWMARARRDRLAQISGPSRYSKSVTAVGAGGGGIYYYYAWTFTDQFVGDDESSKANAVWDTRGDGCCAADVQHQDDVQRNMTAYVAKIAKGVDDGFAPHRQVMASWTTYIADLLALLPPAVPPIPTVAAPPLGGTATPSGDWKSGDQVRYALMAKSTKGPSPASDWSQPLTIGTTVGAVVGGIAAVDGADTIVVVRGFQPSGASVWGDSQQVAALPRPFPATYTDTNPGGDPW